MKNLCHTDPDNFCQCLDGMWEFHTETLQILIQQGVEQVHNSTICDSVAPETMGGGVPHYFGSGSIIGYNSDFIIIFDIF